MATGPGQLEATYQVVWRERQDAELLGLSAGLGGGAKPGGGQGRPVGLTSETSGSGALKAKESSDWPELSGMLRDAARGKGNFGIGSATREQADVMGRAWVGEGYTVASDGKTLVSANGLRQYRPPSWKPNLQRWQANLEWRPEGVTQWQGNAHIDIKP